MAQRERIQTEKGQLYTAERKKSKCISVDRKINRLCSQLQELPQCLDNVNLVQKELEEIVKLMNEFHEAYHEWRDALKDDDVAITYAHAWYNERYTKAENFVTGMKDWIAIAKEKEKEMETEREIQLESSSERASSITSQRSTSSQRAAQRMHIAELTAASNLLQRKQALRNEMERLEIEEKLIAARAKDRVLSETEGNKLEAFESLGRSVPTYLPSNQPLLQHDLRSDLHVNLTVPRLQRPQSKEREDQSTPRPPLVRTPLCPTVDVKPVPEDRDEDQPSTYSHHKEENLDGTYVHDSATVSNATQFSSLARFLDRQNKLTEMLTEQQQRSLLPPLTLTVFSNDPADFVTFIKNFESQIERKIYSNEIRLSYLGQFLKGEAKDLIKGCLYKDAAIGYPEAKALLQEKYGDPYKISNSYIKKASDWPMIQAGDNSALDEFSTFLCSCVSAMESMKYLSILDHPQNLQNLVKKLPTYLQDRWRRQVVKLRETHPFSIPGFKSFSGFIRTEAKIATDPIFSKEALGKTSSKERKPIQPKSSTKDFFRASSHATDVETPNDDKAVLCILCAGTHDLDDCKYFNGKTLEQRKNFLAEKRLCYACFGSGHRSRGCLQKRTCKSCQGLHPTSLHDKNFVPRFQRKENSADVNSTHLQISRAQLPIVPVQLCYQDRCVKTYAMLDTCSTGTFIKDDVMAKLGATGEETKITIGTLNGKIFQSTKAVIGLRVSDVKGQNEIELPRTFTQPSITSSSKYVPSDEALREWPHLAKITEHCPRPLKNQGIGLLIGANCPKALEPRNVIPCVGNSPYAILTFAGWTLVGPRSPELPDHIETHHVHFISSVKEVISPQDLNRMMDLEFNERTDNFEAAYSREDQRFIQILEDGVLRKNGHFIMPLPFRKDDVRMPENREQAEVRASYLKKRLIKNPKMHADYVKTMKDVLSNNYARKVPDDRTTKKGKSWYLPHHGVYHPKKPEKLRVVFDCSARFGGVS